MTKRNFYRKKGFLTYAVVLLTVMGTLLFAGCTNETDTIAPVSEKHTETGTETLGGTGGNTGNNGSTPANITITVKGDTNVIVNEPKIFRVKKDASWKTVRSKISVVYNDGYEEGYWKAEKEATPVLEDGYIFENDTTVFAVSRPKDSVSYTVKYYKQNLNDDNYTLAETKMLYGKQGELTAAEMEVYPGFTAEPVTQETIQNNGNTVVNIKYTRKIITLTFNLKGGTTETPLLAGGTLQGKFEAPIIIATPEKSEYAFNGWEPELPATFPAENTTYTVKWTAPYRITITGDERVQPGITVNIGPGIIWKNAKRRIKKEFRLKPEWEIYSQLKDFPLSMKFPNYTVNTWKISNADGEIINDTYIFTGDTTIYAATNYNLFNTHDSNLIGYDGESPKGKITIPPYITSIGKKALYACTFTAINLSKNITTIGEDAFRGCRGLTSLDLPDGLASIGEWAFAGCTGLTTLSLPKNLNSTGKFTFCDCRNLETVTLPQGLTSIDEGAFSHCTNLTTVNLPESLYSIKSYAFSSCKTLTAIILPEHLVLIEEQAFSQCAGLTTVNLPQSIISIGKQAFYLCTNLDTIRIQSHRLKTIDVDAFRSIKPSARFRVKTSAIKSLILNSQSGILGSQIEVVDNP